MNNNGFFGAVMALFIIAILGGLIVFRPNTVRGFFGKDPPPGNDAEVQVARDELKARAETVATEMEAAARDHDRLEEEVAILKRYLEPVMRQRRVRETEYPELWKEAKRPTDAELVAVFNSLQKRVSEAQSDLGNGGNPSDWEGLIEKGRKKARELSEQTERRKEALGRIKDVFVRPAD